MGYSSGLRFFFHAIVLSNYVAAMENKKKVLRTQQWGGTMFSVESLGHPSASGGVRETLMNAGDTIKELLQKKSSTLKFVCFWFRIIF